MSTRRRTKLAISVLAAAIFAVGAFLTPGIRHRHKGGEHIHTHRAPHHHHGQTHGSHHHHHGHSHSHHHHGSASAARPAETIETATAHIHLSLFGFELTLPDFLGGDSAPLTTSTSPPRRQAKSKSPVVAEFRAPLVLPQIVRFVMEIRCLVPARISLASDDLPPAWLAALPSDGWGQNRPEPPVPPPRTA